MNRRILAGFLTIAVLGLVVAAGARRPSTAPGGTSRHSSDTPESVVSQLIADASKGDTKSYLNTFTGPLRDRLAREAEEAGPVAFAERLRAASSARKGHAIHAPEPDGPNAVRIAVESVYPDRNERQVYRLEREPDGWWIVEVDTIRGRVPAARFGAPASFREPEGVPVEGVETPDESENPGP